MANSPADFPGSGGFHILCGVTMTGVRRLIGIRFAIFSIQYDLDGAAWRFQAEFIVTLYKVHVAFGENDLHTKASIETPKQHCFKEVCGLLCNTPSRTHCLRTTKETV